MTDIGKSDCTKIPIGWQRLLNLKKTHWGKCLMHSFNLSDVLDDGLCALKEAADDKDRRQIINIFNYQLKRAGLEAVTVHVGIAGFFHWVGATIPVVYNVFLLLGAFLALWLGRNR